MTRLLLNKFPSRLLPWCVCLAASLFFAYELTQLHMLNAISLPLMRDLGLSGTSFGSLASTYLLADVVFLMPAGMLIDRFSPRRTILVALALCVIGTFAFAGASSLAIAALSHFISGIGNAFCFLSCMILAARWFPQGKQAFVIGTIITIGLLGGVIAQAPFALLTEALGWRGALYVDGFIGLGILAVIFLFVHEPREAVPSPATAIPFWKQFTSCWTRHTVACGIYTGCLNLPVMIIGAMLGNLFLTQIHGFIPSTAAFITSLLCLGTIIGSPLIGRLADIRGEKRGLMRLGALSSCLLLLLLMYMPSSNPLLYAALFFFIGLCTSTQVLGYPAITENTPPHLSGTAMGIAAVIIMGGAGLLQIAAGALLDMGWNGALEGGVPLYGREAFRLAFVIFPVSAVVALGMQRYVTENKGFAQAS